MGYQDTNGYADPLKADQILKIDIGKLMYTHPLSRVNPYTITFPPSPYSAKILHTHKQNQTLVASSDFVREDDDVNHQQHLILMGFVSYNKNIFIYVRESISNVEKFSVNVWQKF